jgi:hypothetical protein
MSLSYCDVSGIRMHQNSLKLDHKINLFYEIVKITINIFVIKIDSLILLNM